MTDPAPPENSSENLRGCLKAGILGCGGALLVFLVMAVLAVSVVSRHPGRYRPVLGKLFDALEEEIAQEFGSDVTPADRAAFASARDRFRSGWAEGRVPASAADGLRRRLISDARKSRLDRAEARALTDYLNRLAATP